MTTLPTPERPSTYAALIAAFGDPAEYSKSPAGVISAQWERDHMVRINLPQTLPLSWNRALRIHRITVHRNIAALFTAVYTAIDEAGLWPELRDYGGAYTYRTKRGGGSGSGSALSMHAWGIAVDHDVARNPLGGGVGVMHPGIIAAFEAQGFVWGGRFKGRTDPMHFQYATGDL